MSSGSAQRLEVDHLQVAALGGSRCSSSKTKADAAAHAGGEVAAGRADDDGDAAGHVLAAVVAGPFDDGLRPAVADAEPLAGPAAEERPAARRPVERDVADQDVVLGDEPRRPGREDDDLAAGEPLADVVVGVALERQRDPARHERAEALAGRAGELELDRVVGQAGAAVPPRQLAAEDRADRAVDVADRQLERRPARPARAPAGTPGSSVVQSSDCSRPWSWSSTLRTATSGPTSGR